MNNDALLKYKISEFFSMFQALYLPTWKRCGNEADGLTKETQDNVTKVAKVLDSIKTLLNREITIDCWWRPVAYNALPSIGGTPNSAHIKGLAVDFKVVGMTADEVREKLLPHLEALGIRMENKPGSSWIHIDLMPPNPHRYFNV